VPRLPRHPLPDPDQVPRRVASARRPVARPRVRHEGLLLLRPRRRGTADVVRRTSRGLPAHLRAARPRLPDRLRGQRRDGRLGKEFTGADTLKNVVLKTKSPGASSWELLVVGVPGDREVDLKRIAGQLEPVEVAQADADDLAKEPRLVRGYIGPQLLADIGVRYLVDPMVVPGSAWITGANEADKHAA